MINGIAIVVERMVSERDGPRSTRNRRVQGRRRRLIAAAVAALFSLMPRPTASPLGAQQPRECGGAGCGNIEARQDSLRREMEQALRDLERASRALGLEQWATDTSDAARERLTRLQRELKTASRRLTRAMAPFAQNQSSRWSREAGAEAMRVTREAQEDAMRVTREAMSNVRIRMAPGDADAPHPPQSPQGWLGVVLSAEPDRAPSKGSGGLIRFREYPIIEAVEPGSPADRAGIASGDRLMALAGRDVTEGAPSFQSLLEPGARLPVRVKRAAETRNVIAIITRRPQNWGWSYAPRVAPGMLPRGVRPPVPPTPASPSEIVVGPPLAQLAFGGSSALAGAELMPMREGLREYFGDVNGLLVLRVAPGAAAERAGLRDGDVIVGAGGVEVTSLRALQSALRQADGRALPLEIVRKKERRTVTLRW